MTYSVYQHWDPLKVCVVGRSYPPEFYSWIKIPHVRSLFEKIAIETEEDYQNIIKKLKSFDVEVLRPDIPSKTTTPDGKYIPPPMTPRDYFVVIGDSIYVPSSWNWSAFYQDVKDPSWPNNANFLDLPLEIQNECIKMHNWSDEFVPETFMSGTYSNVFRAIKDHLQIKPTTMPSIVNGAMVSRIGKDLYFGTNTYNDDLQKSIDYINKTFTNTRNHIVNTGGHSDATYCPVCPGLIISLEDVPTYATTFPNWEVVYLPGQSWQKVKPFLHLKEKNKGRWWIPGFEYDQDVVDFVETWIGHWTGYVEETVFDVNMLIIDSKNVMVFNYNKQVFDALDRFGITPHVVPFRHRYFWDGGIHCVTSDLHRVGVMQDYFPQRV